MSVSLTVGLIDSLAVVQEPLAVFAKQVCSKGAYRKHCLDTGSPPVLLRRCAGEGADRKL